MKTDRIYKLGESTELFFNGDTEVIFRKGVWNYEEALLDLSVFDDATQELVLDVMRTLAEGDSITAEKLLDIFGTDQESAEKVAELLEELTEQAYISNGAEDRVKELITHLIVGTASMGFGGNAGGYSSTLLVCDSNIVTEQLEIMSGQISLPMEVLSEEDTAEIAAADLTGILFALEQALFTSSGRQCLSMVLASLGISFVACVSTAYTGSFLPCLLEHECFLVFYFGRFRYY